MNKGILALALAFGVLPIGALAQNSNAAPPSDAQRQAMRQTFEQFAQQKRQLHEQMRYQILSSLSVVHRRAIAAEIGNLAISPNPDIQSAVRRIDALLSSGERARIMSAHEAYKTQSHQLHEQMMSAMQSQMPGHQMPQHHDMHAEQSMHQNDAGYILLRALTMHDDHDRMH